MGALLLKQVFLLLLGATYVGMGAFIYLKKVVPQSPWGEILAIAFVSYGIWRIWRAIRKPSPVN